MEKAKQQSSHKAPGPKGLAALGLVAAFKKNAAETMLALQRRHGDMVQFSFAGRFNSLIAHPDMIQEVLIDKAALFEKGKVYRAYEPLIGQGLLTSDGAVWEKTRRIATPSFKGPRLRAFTRIAARASQAAAAQWAREAKGGWLDLAVVPEMNRLTFEIIATALFSENLSQETARLFHALDGANKEGTARIRSAVKPPFGWPTPANRRYRSAVAVLDEVVAVMIERRLHAATSPEGPPDDYFTALVAAMTAGEIDRKMVRDQVLTFLFAGHETTSNGLSWALYLLAGHPQVADKAAREVAQTLRARPPEQDDLAKLPYLRAIFEESMRLYPPIYALQRRALADVQVGGFAVPAGTGVTISPYVTHRHPAFWDDPAGFNPERFLGAAAQSRPRLAYLPFGAGPRTCIGANFAMAEAVVLLVAVLQRFKLARWDDQPVATRPLISLGPAGPLPVRLLPR